MKTPVKFTVTFDDGSTEEFLTHEDFMAATAPVVAAPLPDEATAPEAPAPEAQPAEELAAPAPDAQETN